MDVGRNAPELLDLIRDHYALVYRYAYRLSGSAADAEDLTQQTFLTAQLKLEQLRCAENAKAWLCTIVRNGYLKNCRAGNGAALCSLENIAELAEARPENACVDQDELQKTLNELPEEFRTPLFLYNFEEFSYKDIAEQVGVPIGTVMSRLARAKSHLRRRLCAHSVTTDSAENRRLDQAVWPEPERV
jgi:RNA polymerase sigma-70 factor (ECF subfamily)